MYATSTPLRIGIEAQRLFRPHKHGMDIVALELLRHLQQPATGGPHEYVVFVKPDTDRAVLRESANMRIVEVPGGSYPHWEQVLLPRAARTAGVQLLHCTSNTAPLRPGVPLVLTLHDIIYLERVDLRKGSLYQRAGNLYRRWNVPRVVSRCERILTVSDFERQRIEAALPGAAPVQTVYNSVGAQFRPVTDAAALAAARARYQLPERFLFFLANTDPKKNLRGVLRALALLDAQNALGDLQLVMLDYAEDALAAVLREVGAPHLRARIRLCGYVPNQELPLIYSLAEVFLYPSLRESFGIPILEAMACGVPVITSNTSSMPEVAGDAARFVDPFRPETIAEAIRELHEQPALRAELAARGLARAAQFSWAGTAQQVRQVYEGVLSLARQPARQRVIA